MEEDQDVCMTGARPSEVRSDAVLAELQFLRHMAEMRGTCDGCGTRRAMIALSDDKWLCYDCTIAANAESEVSK